MPRRKWRARARREELSAALVLYLTTATLPPPDSEDLRMFLYTTPNSTSRAALWLERGVEITSTWIRDNPGSRPWCWWMYDASEPRRCLVGAELLYPVHNPGDWDFVWRGHWGVPAFLQCRPLGYVGFPAVESQAAYLDRLGLLAAEERAALGDDAFDPEDVNPFHLTAEELAKVPRGARRAD